MKRLKIYCFEKCKVDDKQCKECEDLEHQYFRFKFQVKKNSARSQTIIPEETLLSTFANHLTDRKIKGKVLVFE
jgi:hypothetical protein